MARLAAGVRKRKDGTLEKRFTIKGKRYSVYGKTNKEITEKEQEIREKIKQGIYTDNRNITLDGYFEEWIERKRKTVKAGSIYNYQRYYKQHISPAFGSRKIQDLEKREIYLLQNTLAEKYHPTNVNYVFKVLRMILNDAVADDVILKSPAYGIKNVKNTEAPASENIHRALTEEEQRSFMEAAKDHHYYELFAFLLLTGMRYGEAAALTWNEIDYKNNVIHIVKNRTLSEDGSVMIGTPKTQSSVRDIPMNEAIRRILQMQRKKKNLLDGVLFLPGSGRIFSTPRDQIVSSGAINKAILNVISKMDHPIEKFTAHAFRDTFATRYIEQGGNPQTLKTILGHNSLAMTMDLYSHVLPNTKQKEMDLLQISI